MNVTAQAIVVVDDVAFTRRYLCSMVGRMGYFAVEAGSARYAQQFLLQHRPKAVLLDLVMPKMNGAELCKWMREREALADVPVIIHTAHRVGRLCEEAIVAGANAILEKPVNYHKLQASLAAISAPPEIKAG